MNSKITKVIRNFPKPVHIMVITEGILSLAMGAFSFLKILYYDYVMLPPRQIGYIFSIGSILSLLAFFMAPYMKKYGRKNTMCMGLVLVSIGILFHIFFMGYYPLLLGQIFISIGYAMIQISDIQLLYDYAEGVNECCAYSYKYSTGLICEAIGSVLAGNVSKLPFSTMIQYKLLFISSFIVVVLGTAARYFLLPKMPKVIPLVKEGGGSLSEIIKIIKGSNKIRKFSGLLFLVTLSFGGVGPYNNLILKNQFGFTNSVISYITFVITFLSMGAIIFMPYIIEVIGVEWFNKISFISVIASCFLLSIINNPVIFTIVLVVRCVFALLVCSSLDCIMMSSIDPNERDVFASIKILSNGISSAAGNFIGGEILNYIGYRFNYIFGGGVILLSLIFFLSRVRTLMTVERIDDGCNCRMKNRGFVCRNRGNCKGS